MKKVFYFLLLSMLVIVMTLIGCQSTTEVRREEGQHEQVAIDILSMGFGGSGYVASFVLSDIINKNSDWLRATTQETAGTVYNINALREKPDIRENTIIYGTYALTSFAEKGIEPFDKPYSGIKALVTAQSVAHSYVTTDPDIQSGHDFAGKRVGLVEAGSAGNIQPLLLMEHAWDIMDKVNIEYLGWSNAISALRDGMVDVAIANPIFIGENELSMSPALEELMSLRSDYHFVNLSKEDVEMAQEKGDFYMPYKELAVGTMGATQTEPIGVALIINGWLAAEELPDEIAYEICRIIYEHYEEFWPRHASLQGLSPEIMGELAPNKADFHPGAIKFFEEHGIEIGVN